MSNAFLCGFMGCGKTTIAKLVSSLTILSLLDTDLEIEKIFNMSTLKIFEKYGEHKFRLLETQILKHINKKNNLIVATGGATLISNNNHEIVKSNSLIIFFNTSFEICFNRIKNSNRPLVKSKTKNQLEQLFINRQNQYKKIANFTITETVELNVESKLHQTLEILKHFKL